MAENVFLVFDNETGGLDPRLSPLLSTANLIVNSDFEEVDGFELKFIPPQGTLIEVPIPAHQDGVTKKKTIDYWMDVLTKERTKEKPIDAPVITAYAAEVNYFVRVVEGQGWDMSAIDEWISQGVEIDEGERTYRMWLRQGFNRKPNPVAHNIDFDLKFHGYYLPNLLADFARHLSGPRAGEVQGIDTCTLFRRVQEARQQEEKRAGNRSAKKGGAKLSDLAAAAGYDFEGNAHEALSDCRACLAGLKWMVDAKHVTLDTIFG